LYCVADLKFEQVEAIVALLQVRHDRDLVHEELQRHFCLLPEAVSDDDFFLE
jgi:hypothetical protein